MAEQTFLDILVQHLDGPDVLDPPPETIGFAVPDQVNDMPSVVLWLEKVHHTGRGLGERNMVIVDGMLSWDSTIDLSDPVLPSDPSLVLLTPDRLQLTLPHSGLVKSDGTRGPLTPSDIEVTVDGALRAVVSDSPGADEVAADPLTGVLTFGAALPGTGDVSASYFLGQWEQRVQQIAGELVIDVMARDAVDVSDLSRTVLAALSSPVAVDPQIKGLRVSELSRIGLPDNNNHNVRTRTLRLTFEFERVVDVPEVSGGIIRHVPIAGEVQALRANPTTGAIAVDTATEDTEVPIPGLP